MYYVHVYITFIFDTHYWLVGVYCAVSFLNDDSFLACNCCYELCGLTMHYDSVVYGITAMCVHVYLAFMLNLPIFIYRGFSLAGCFIVCVQSIATFSCCWFV